MSWESFASVSTGEMPQEETWILFALRLARTYVLLVCGSPPEGCDLDVMWHDHELGSYPSLGLWSEWSHPWDYFHKCERALEQFDSAVQWSDIKQHYEASFLLENEDEA